MMNKKAGKMMITALALAAALSLTGCGSSGETPSTEKTTTEAPVETVNTEAGESAKDGSDLFSTMDTVDIEGNKADASVFAENKVTFVNLWNLGCTPCIEELPILAQLSREYEGKGFAMKGLYYSAASTLTDTERTEILEILKKADADFQQFTLSDEMIENNLIENIQAFPTTFVVDSEGNIVNKIEGSNDYDGWKKAIEDEMGKVK